MKRDIKCSMEKGHTSLNTNEDGWVLSTIAAKEDVMTTRLTEGALLLIACRIPTVPLMAILGYRISLVELETDKAYKGHTGIEQFLLRVRSFEMKGTRGMDNGIKRRIRDDSLVESWKNKGLYVSKLYQRNIREELM